ncbi:MAG: ethanolamine ammonia-lyase subunit EutB [Vicinamibacterales bacterium]
MDSRALRQTLVLANAFKEGDLLVGGTRDARVRDEARRALAGVSLLEIRGATLIEDGVTDTLARALDVELAREIDRLTVAELRNILLAPRASAWITRYRDGLSSEAIASVAKVMTGDELGHVARAVFNPLPGDGVAVGSSSHFGSRIQPNSPGDDGEEILFSILEGLAYGCGDVILGLNPASDDLDTIVRLEEALREVVVRLALPTRYCVLSDIVKQHRARERAAVDVGFQSLAGTSSALLGMVGLDADGVLDLARSFDGLYFETGQGSAVTNGAAEGVDMVTLEARAYGVARCIRRQTGAWTIVNDVAGFIGPEVFRTVEQLERACLEDAVMAKLHGLTMGLDVCATFHMGIPPAALREATARIVTSAAPAYLMAVPGNADPMLGYLTTSFREHPRLRRRSGRRMASAMERRLADLGVREEAAGAPETTAMLFAVYAKAGGDRRTAPALVEEGMRTLHELRLRSFDLGYGCGPDDGPPAGVDSRLDAIYEHARRALYAMLDDDALRDASPGHVRVRTEARDREDYLAHPPAGERLCAEDAAQVVRLRAPRRPEVQFVISDGLNADAVSEQVRALLPPLRRALGEAGRHLGAIDVIVQNGRVRAGYEIGGLVGAAVIVHVIGERPGTGLNTVSAYLTYGNDAAGVSRWRRDLDHSCTTAICGIHPRGLPPADAAQAIARTVDHMIAERRSGVALHGASPR